MSFPDHNRMTQATLKPGERPVIPYIEGDGIGPDIWKATMQVLDQAVKKTYGDTRKILWKEVLAGEKAFHSTGEWLPASTLDTLRSNLLALKGPLTTPVGGGIRSLNVTLRQELDLYACVRPVRWFEQVPSPLKHPELVDMVIFRENTEDIYAGIEWMEGTQECDKLRNFLQKDMGVENIRFPDSSSLAIKPISREGSERLIRAAIGYALDHHRPSVTMVHKGTDSANPSSLILSGVMLLEFLEWTEAAELIVTGLTTAIRRKKVTLDFYRRMSDATLVTCSEFAAEIIRQMNQTQQVHQNTHNKKK